MSPAMLQSSRTAQGAVDVRTASEFWEQYRRPGVRYLGLATLMGGISALGFYGIDALGGVLPWFGGAQTLRLIIATVCFFTAALTALRSQWATQIYPWFFRSVVTLCIALGCYTTLIRWSCPHISGHGLFAM